MARLLRTLHVLAAICLLATAAAGQVDSNFNDGPYVLWQNDSTVVVFYFCGHDLLSNTLPCKDSVIFNGLCNDSANSYRVYSRPETTESKIFSNVSRVFAVSDLHGEYTAFVEILVNNCIIDRSLRWQWDSGHLVIVGDVFDRGKQVNECLWLIRELTRQARAAGGEVHLLLGNHELMILRGDVRYVNEHYSEGIVRESRISYADLYGLDMEIGRWLRTLPLAITINDILYTHAGLAPDLVDRHITVDSINTLARYCLDISPERAAFDAEFKDFSGSAGPFWYRGYFEAKDGRYAQATPDDITRTCGCYDISTIVVGHTESDELTGYYENRVIAIDVPVDELGGQQGLLVEDGTFYKVTADGTRIRIK